MELPVIMCVLLLLVISELKASQSVVHVVKISIGNDVKLISNGVIVIISLRTPVHNFCQLLIAHQTFRWPTAMMYHRRLLSQNLR